MGLLAFGVFCLITVGIAYFLVWILDRLLPGHPGIIDSIIWVLAVIIIVFQLAGALGLHDVTIPRLK